MEMMPIHITPVGLSKHPEFIKGTKNWFKAKKDNFNYVEQNGNFKTTLKVYGHKTETLVPQDNTYKKFEAVILKNARQFLSQCGYGVENHTLKVNKIWMNEMLSGSFHNRHNHHGCLVSGCFYVEVPKNSESITFTTPLTDNKCFVPYNTYTLFNSGTWTLSLQPGDMLMWESYLFHEVRSTEFEGVRQSVAFDVVIE